MFIGEDGWFSREGHFWARVDGRCFMEVQELAAISVLAEAMVFEVGAKFGFIVLVEGMFVPEFVLSMGKGTLPYQKVTASLKGQ